MRKYCCKVKNNKKLRVCKCAAACPPHTIIPVFISLVQQKLKKGINTFDV